MRSQGSQHSVITFKHYPRVPALTSCRGWQSCESSGNNGAGKEPGSLSVQQRPNGDPAAASSKSESAKAFAMRAVSMMNFISKNTKLPDSEQSDREDPWYLSAVIL